MDAGEDAAVGLAWLCAALAAASNKQRQTIDKIER
jgi:hypothetical protein